MSTHRQGARLVDPVPLGIVLGALFASVDVALMFPMAWPSRRQKFESIVAAAIERFLIGLLIPTSDIGLPHLFAGAILGGALSLPSAIISRAYLPIVGVGVVGGLIIGLISQVLL